MGDKALNDKLDKILKNQEKILKREKKLEELEKQELKNEEEFALSEEKAHEEIEKLEEELHKSSSPLSRITKKDFIKGFIGAFIGVMSHFAFTKAASIAPEISFYRATLLYIIAFIIIIGMLYYTGFKSVKKKTIFHFLPIRATVLYSVSIFTIIFVNLLFGQINFPATFTQLYSLISANIILAVIGAATADLIGKVEE